MGTLKTFNGIFALLVSQFILLLLVAFVDADFAWSSAPNIGGATGIAGYLVMLAAMLALLWLVWSALLEPVEICWGTSAKVRVGKWLLPALMIASGLFLAAAAVTFGAKRVWPNGMELILPMEITLLLPIAVTALLLVSAARRWKSIQAGIGAMRKALGSTGLKESQDRIRESIAWEAGTSQISVRANPQGFTFAGLTSKPWHDPAEFSWLPAFVDAVDDLRAEAEAVLTRHDDRIEQYHYVGLGGNFWTNFSFVKRHEEITENLALCPAAASLLKTVRGYPAFRDAMYSILAPNGVIRPHRDVSNVFLTLHLPLVVPGGGHIEVGGIKREWRYGEPLIFDSSYTHKAVNLADKPRLILLLDFPHPDLTEAELDWIRASRI